jgi:hypothetical protein
MSNIVLAVLSSIWQPLDVPPQTRIQLIFPPKGSRLHAVRTERHARDHRCWGSIFGGEYLTEGHRVLGSAAVISASSMISSSIKTSGAFYACSSCGAHRALLVVLIVLFVWSSLFVWCPESRGCMLRGSVSLQGPGHTSQPLGLVCLAGRRSVRAARPSGFACLAGRRSVRAARPCGLACLAGRRSVRNPRPCGMSARVG